MKGAPAPFTEGKC